LVSGLHRKHEYYNDCFVDIFLAFLKTIKSYQNR